MVFNALARRPGLDEVAATRLKGDTDVDETGDGKPVIDLTRRGGTGQACAEQMSRPKRARVAAARCSRHRRWRCVRPASARETPRGRPAPCGTRSITQFEITTSPVLSAIGKCSISPETEFDVCGSDRLGIGPRLRQHFMRRVDADHPAGRPDLLSRQKAIDPGAAAEIDKHLARAHRRQRLRIAAAEPEIGALGQRGELRRGITHANGGVFRCGAGAATAHAARSDPAVPVANRLLDRGAAVYVVILPDASGPADFDILRNVLDKDWTS